jgi:hypothetical protein
VNGVPTSANAGESFEIAPGVRHAWWNPSSSEEAQIVVEFRPALRTEDFLNSVFALARDGKTNEKGIPHFWQMAVLLAEYRDEFRPARIPRAIEWLITRLVAPIARARGYAASYTPVNVPPNSAE